MQGEVARKIPFCQNFPTKTEKIAKHAEYWRAPFARAKTFDTPLHYTGNERKKTRPAQIPHPLAPSHRRVCPFSGPKTPGWYRNFRRPRLLHTKDYAIPLSPAPLAAPEFGQESGWPTPSVNGKARKKESPLRELFPNYCSAMGVRFFPSSLFSAAPRDNLRRPCCDMQGRRTQRASPNKHVTRIDFPANGPDA